MATTIQICGCFMTVPLVVAQSTRVVRLDGAELRRQLVNNQQRR
jgi:hypothetical protein